MTFLKDWVRHSVLLFLSLFVSGWLTISLWMLLETIDVRYRKPNIHTAYSAVTIPNPYRVGSEARGAETSEYGSNLGSRLGKAGPVVSIGKIEIQSLARGTTDEVTVTLPSGGAFILDGGGASLNSGRSTVLDGLGQREKRTLVFVSDPPIDPEKDDITISHNGRSADVLYPVVVHRRGAKSFVDDLISFTVVAVFVGLSFLVFTWLSKAFPAKLGRRHAVIRSRGRRRVS